jgi:hypothetical protein
VHILCRAEVDGVICSGARSGKQFTYALLDERAPQTKELTRNAALAELTRRYFTSRGPATLQDFVWWSGLSTADAMTGIEMIQRRLAKEMIDGRTYWFMAPVKGSYSNRATLKRGQARTPAAYLLPTYDEYLIAYKDRSAALEMIHSKQSEPENAVFSSPIVMGGRVVGRWKRTFKGDSVNITLSSFALFSKAEKQAVEEAAHRYGSFLGMRVVLD